MELVVVELVLALLKAVPPLIAAVQSSSTLSAEEKAKALADIRTRLDAAKERVAAVKFRDI